MGPGRKRISVTVRKLTGLEARGPAVTYSGACPLFLGRGRVSACCNGGRFGLLRRYCRRRGSLRHPSQSGIGVERAGSPSESARPPSGYNGTCLQVTQPPQQRRRPDFLVVINSTNGVDDMCRSSCAGYHRHTHTHTHRNASEVPPLRFVPISPYISYLPVNISYLLSLHDNFAHATLLHCFSKRNTSILFIFKISNKL